MARESKSARDTRVVSFVKDAVQKSELATREDRQRYFLAENLFRGKQDWGAAREENEWMAKIFIHEFSVIIRRAAASVMSLMFNGREYFSLLPPTEADKEFSRILEKALRYYVERVGFDKKIYDYCIDGGTFGIAIWKCTADLHACYKPEYVIEELRKDQEKTLKGVSKEIEVPQDIISNPDAFSLAVQKAFEEVLGEKSYSAPKIITKKYLEFRPNLSRVLPWNFFYHPDSEDLNDSPWVCEQLFPSYFEIESYFKNGIWDKKKQEAVRSRTPKISSFAASMLSTYEGQRLYVRDQLTQASSFDRKCQVYEYYGPFINEHGETEEECRRFIVCNDELVLEQQIPYWGQRHPYFITKFSAVPGKAVGAGISDNAIPNQLTINELASLKVDQLTRDTYGMTVVNVSQLQDESQLDAGFAPNEIIRAYSEPDAVIAPVNLSNNNTPEVLQFLEFLKLSGAKAATIDTTSSNPSSRSRISATEVSTNMDRTNESVGVLVDALDREGVQPVLQWILGLILQFGLSNDNLISLQVKGVLSSDEINLIKNLPSNELFNEITRPYRIEVKGFKEVVRRNEYLSRLMELLQQVNMDQSAASLFQKKNLYSQIIMAMGLETADLMVQDSPQDKAREENQLLMRGQMVSNGQNDQDSLELPVHYELASQNPSQEVMAHISGHIRRMMQTGQQPPPPPPEIAEMLGLPPQMGSENLQ